MATHYNPTIPFKTRMKQMQDSCVHEIFTCCPPNMVHDPLGVVTLRTTVLD